MMVKLKIFKEPITTELYNEYNMAVIFALINFLTL